MKRVLEIELIGGRRVDRLRKNRIYVLGLLWDGPKWNFRATKKSVYSWRA